MSMEGAMFGNDPGVRGESEGRVAKAIEKRTAKVPSDLFLWAAGAAVLGSMALQFINVRHPFRMLGRTGARVGHLSLFVGQWAPTFLLLGLYNKLVKTVGSEGLMKD